MATRCCFVCGLECLPAVSCLLFAAAVCCCMLCWLDSCGCCLKSELFISSGEWISYKWPLDAALWVDWNVCQLSAACCCCCCADWIRVPVASKMSYLSVLANEYCTNGHSMLLCDARPPRTKIAVTRTSELVAVQWGWFCFAWVSRVVLFFSTCNIVRVCQSHYQNIWISLSLLKNSLSLKHDNESTHKYNEY